MQFSTNFIQVYTRPKKKLLGSSLAFTLKEGPVRCAKVCNKSWVILKYLLQRYVGCGVFNFQHFKSICNYLVVTNLKRMNNFLNLKPGNIYLRNLKPKCQIDSDIHRKNSRIFFVDLSYYLCCI